MGTLKKSSTALAAVLLVIAFAGLLGAWFATGWPDAQRRAEAARAEPAHAAEARGTALGDLMRAELASLVARETARPYFHYQNLFHDPRAGGVNVAPSPLASGPQDPLVAGYFQVDDHGRVTTPTINDDVPSLSEQTGLAEHRAFRDAIAKSRLGAATHVLVAAAGNRVTVDNNSYFQNSRANEVFVQQNTVEVPRQMADMKPVAITEFPFVLRTERLGGERASLVAVRAIQTPDATFTQGFAIDDAALLQKAAPGERARLVTNAGGSAEVVPDWRVAIDPDPGAVAAAAIAGDDLVRGFILRFAIVGCVALLAGAIIVRLVAKAEALARERSQFAAAAAHELRTPLAGLQLYGDMLAGGLGDPDKQRDYAKRMSEEASRLGRVVSNVLGFSQLERGNLSVTAEPGPLGAALCELAEHAQPALDRAGAALALDVAPDLRARFDRDALARIVANLLDNAEKYGRDAADRTITLAARRAADGVDVVVVDHGPGLPERGRLFDPFRPFQRGVGEDAPAGLGLGLALSRSLARAMGGELTSRPTEGGGATFVLRLPA